jgi:hypothetical protein
VISARADRRAEDVRVVPVVITELELRDVEREVLGADLVESTDHAALQDRPKAFDGLGVDRTDDVLAVGVVNAVVRVGAVKAEIAPVLVGAEQADLLGYRLIDEGVERAGAGVGDHAGDHVALTRDGAHDDFLADSASPLMQVALVLVAVASLAAHERLIDLHDAHELLKALIHEPSADAVAHVVGGFVGAETHHALYLEGAYALLAGQHEVDHAKPLAQRLVRVLEDGPGDVGEAVALIGRAGVALPLEAHGGHGEHLHRTAARAVNAIGPAVRHQIGRAGVFIREHLLKLRDGHLLNAGHGGHSQAMELTYA